MCASLEKGSANSGMMSTAAWTMSCATPSISFSLLMELFWTLYPVTVRFFRSFLLDSFIPAIRFRTMSHSSSVTSSGITSPIFSSTAATVSYSRTVSSPFIHSYSAVSPSCSTWTVTSWLTRSAWSTLKRSPAFVRISSSRSLSVQTDPSSLPLSFPTWPLTGSRSIRITGYWLISGLSIHFSGRYKSAPFSSFATGTTRVTMFALLFCQVMPRAFFP